MDGHLDVEGGRLAYEDHGTGPLVVLAHGMGNSRRAYRFLAPALVRAGYRTVALDLRGCGVSDAGWGSYSRSAIAGDLIALLHHLGEPAILVGHSISGGAVTIAAAREPELVTGVVEIAPFTRRQRFRLGDLRVPRYRRGLTRLAGMMLLGSRRQWARYLDVAVPGVRPSDWTEDLGRIDSMLSDGARMRALRRMGTSSPTEGESELAGIRCPVLVIEGALDPDWVSPEGEGEAIVRALPQGAGELAVIEAAGHYPHVQCPEETLAAVLPFLASTRDRTRA